MTNWLDVIVGVSLLGVATAGVRTGRPRRFIVAAGAAGTTWLLAVLLPAMVLVHRPFVALMIVTLRSDRPVGPWGGVLVAAAFVDVFAPRSVGPVIAAVTAGLALAVARWDTNAWRPGGRGEVVATRNALLVYAAALVLPPLLRRWPSGVAWQLPLLAYLLGILLVGLIMIVGMVASRHVETDAVIELVDADPAQALHRLERLLSPGVGGTASAPIATALRLLREHRRLQRELADRVEDVRESRTRLLAAAADERRRLAEALDRGAMRYLVELDRCLELVAATCGRDARAVASQCRGQVARTLEELRRLARGLHPPTLSEQGLAVALAELADRSILPVDLTVPAGRFGEPAERTLWYACAEALTNAGKHAHASRVRLDVTASEVAAAAHVDDDGVGGATLTEGGGLTGLVDRLASVGGRLSVTSPAAGGTRITVTVPRS